MLDSSKRICIPVTLDRGYYESQKLIVSGFIGGLFSLTLALPALAIIVLPDQPTSMDPTETPMVDGIRWQSYHDDFWSYSNQSSWPSRKKTSTCCRLRPMAL